MRPSVIATLATGPVKADLELFLFTLTLWNEVPPTVYLACDAPIAAAVPAMDYKGRIVVNQTLDKYSGLTRAEMERMPGATKDLWVDFMLEKTVLLEWVLTKESSALFCDSDICFMGPLFDIPASSTLAVSRHHIREKDEARFGRYNGGMIWVTSRAQVDLWRTATARSRFFEQAAIEDVVAAATGVYQIPQTENYGWWRLWQ